jgi:Flp pilus assembly protein TadG
MLSESDRGVTTILVASSLILLMGIAAFAVDYSAALNERRQDQSAADTAALGGGLELIISTSANNVQAAVDEAKRLAEENIGRAIPATDWANCVDPDALQFPSTTPAMGVTGGTECISFNQGFSQMRVRLPVQETATTFGRVLGVMSIGTDAAAEVTIDNPGGGAFPAGVFAGSSAGTEFCIKTGTGSSSHESCGSPTAGNFGTFDPYFYTDLNPGNPDTTCVSGNGQPISLARAMADGLDHQLGIAASSPGNRINGDQCPGFPGPPHPNRVSNSSGYTANDVTYGLINGNNYDGAFTGRLSRGPYVNYSGNSIQVFGVSIDNRPLWSYIDPALASHASCIAATALPDAPTDPTAYAAAKAVMQDCLANQNTQLFSEDIAVTPRLAPVPRYHQAAALTNNGDLYDIKEFVPIFIQGIWTSEANNWTCTGTIETVPGDFCRHEPGMVGVITSSSPGQRKVDSASALLLSCAQLSEPTCRTIQAAGGPSTILFDLHLSR